jgi:hypothetical protein
MRTVCLAVWSGVHEYNTCTVEDAAALGTSRTGNAGWYKCREHEQERRGGDQQINQSAVGRDKERWMIAQREFSFLPP